MEKSKSPAFIRKGSGMGRIDKFSFAIPYARPIMA
jgi:hypothetical protein